MSVNALMASPAARGLFAAAITQSGLGREQSQGLARARSAGRRLVESLGLDDPSAADLRALPAKRVMSLPLEIVRGEVPVVDGTVLPAPVAEVFESGDEAPVPYLVGSTDLEIPDLVLDRAGRDPDAVRDRLVRDNREATVSAYGGEAEFDRHLLSDVLFTEPARHLADLHADDAPTFLYRFAIANPQLRELLGGAPHASEIPFVFDQAGAHPFPVEDGEALADTISDYWVSFATSGRPDHDGAPSWAPYDERGRLMAFGTAGPRLGRDPWTARLDAVEAGYANR
jgi:para-nitrobenzyl esterase